MHSLSMVVVHLFELNIGNSLLGEYTLQLDSHLLT